MCVLKVKVISLPYIFQVLYVLCFTRPRYQVSVYRTIGPLVFTLPGTSDYYVINIVNIRIALSVIGEESICSHLRCWGFSIYPVSVKTAGSDETVRTWSETP